MFTQVPIDQVVPLWEAIVCGSMRVLEPGGPLPPGQSLCDCTTWHESEESAREWVERETAGLSKEDRYYGGTVITKHPAMRQDDGTFLILDRAAYVRTRSAKVERGMMVKGDPPGKTNYTDEQLAWLEPQNG